jgi:hypothetical protein
MMPPPRDPRSVGDARLNLETIERIRAGEPYYAAVGDELRKHNYPTSPLVNWRTPLHYKTVAALSVERAGILLFTLGLVAVVTGALAYSRGSPAKALIAGLFLLGAVAPSLFAQPGSVAFPESWAGVLIALSLNAYVAERWLLGAGLGVLAVFIRELSAPFALVCGLLAFRARRRDESIVWVTGGLAYGIYYAVHAAAASAAIEPGDLARAHSYLRWLGLPFVFMTLHLYGWLMPLPAFLTPLAAAFGLAGGWAPSAPVQLTVALPLYFGLFCMVGHPFDFYWGYLTIGIWGHALIHGIQGGSALLRAAIPMATSWQPNQPSRQLTPGE